MAELKKYDGWADSLRELVQSSVEDIRQALREAETKLAAALKRDARFRPRKSSPATFAEKIAIQVVSCLYFVELLIRAIARSTFASKFLQIFQKLTTDSVALVKKEFGQVPVQVLPASEADGTGGLTVAMLLTSCNRAAVTAILPAGLELIPLEELGEIRSQIPPGEHPVMVGLGFNSNVRPVLMNISFVDMNYLELTVGVPGVRLKPEYGEPSGPFFYIPSLLLNAVTPTLLGWAFGFRKRLKRIKADVNSYSVRRLLSGAPVLQAEVKIDDGSPLEFASNVAGLPPWLNLLDQPIVTRTWWGALRFTFFHWDWQFTPSSPAYVRIQSSGEVPLLAPGAFVFSALDAAPSGDREAGRPIDRAYVMSVPWRLLLPFGRHVLKKNRGLWGRLLAWKRAK